MSFQEFKKNCFQMTEGNVPPVTQTGNAAEGLPEIKLTAVSFTPVSAVTPLQVPTETQSKPLCFGTIEASIPTARNMASDLQRSLTKFGLGQALLSLSILSDAGVSLEFKGEVISALGEIAGCIKTAENIFISRDIYDQKFVLSLNIQEARKKLDPILKNGNLDSFDFAAGIKIVGKILKILENFVEAFPNSDKSHEETLKLRAACKQLRDLDIAAKS